MSMDQWEQHVESLLDELMAPPTQCPDPVKAPSTHPKRRKKSDHPQYIEQRQCKNTQCTASDSDFIVDANGGSVVCIQCGMIQCTGVLESVPTDVDSQGAASITVVHRYSRIAYVRGLLKSIDGETRVSLTPAEEQKIRHYIEVHALRYDGNVDAQLIKQAVRRMGLRKCLCYHAHTIAFRLFRVSHAPPSETEIRVILRRFRALENEWDRAPLDGPLRKGFKKFPYIPFIWKRLCQDEGYFDLSTLIHENPSNTRTKAREMVYQHLRRLAFR